MLLDSLNLGVANSSGVLSPHSDSDNYRKIRTSAPSCLKMQSDCPAAHGLGQEASLHTAWNSHSRSTSHLARAFSQNSLDHSSEAEEVESVLGHALPVITHPAGRPLVFGRPAEQ
jgi:hypothetical protein